ncbi:MAG: GLUG motif-containing protein, partial [Planctomycetota bacterium]
MEVLLLTPRCNNKAALLAGTLLAKRPAAPVRSGFNGYVPPMLTGEGTAASPYLVCDPNGLGAIYHYELDRPDVFYRLDADIDFFGINWTTAPIPVFHGCLDGNDHIIRDLTIEGGGYLGLFGLLYDGKIENLVLEDCNVTGGEYSTALGCLVGYNYYGTISNCLAIGNVSGGNYSDITDSALGGLVGYSECSTIINCYAIGSVSGGDYSTALGGLVGYSEYSTITNCYAAGSISGENNSEYLGGLVGHNFEYSTIVNCYATGSVSGGDTLGGLVGRNFYSSISNCYATGSVNGNNNIGGLLGYDLGSVSNCYATGNVSGVSSFGGLVGNTDYGSCITYCYFLETAGPDNGYGSPLTDAQMQQQSSFVGWDFVGETASGTSQIW